MKVIELVGVESGYCGQCGKPAIVGKFEVRDWKHTFNLCSHCLSILYVDFKQALMVGHTWRKEVRENG